MMLKRHKKRPLTSKQLAVTAVVVSGLLGSLLLSSTHAATYMLSAEAETGSVSGNAATVAQAEVSGGKMVTFGATSCDQAGIQRLVDSVSKQNIEANLRELVQDDSKPTPNELISRHVSQPGNQIKVDWAKQQYTSYGLQIVDQQFSSGGHSLHNVVGRLTGTTPNTLLAVGGHIDSTNANSGSDRSQPAPGADDDGSGVVIAMEAGRVLKAFQPCMKASVDFIGFNDEEENMGGSKKYVADLSGKTFKGLINIDMIGWTGGKDGQCVEHFYNKASRTYEKQLFDKWTEANTKYSVNLPLKPGTYDASDVDSHSFWAANQPSIFDDECNWGDYPGYHRTTDNIKNEDFDQLTRVAKLVVATLAELSKQ